MKGSLPRLVLVPLILAATAWGEDKPKGLSTESPFAPAGGAAAPGAPANENIEFAGVTTIGKRTDLIFYDKTAKKSHWLAKGETKAGITLLNYDAQREQAVVKVNGVEKVLTLRKGKGATGAPSQAVTTLPAGFNVSPSTGVPGVTLGPTSGVAMAGNSASTPEAPPPAKPSPAPSGPVTPEMQARQETEARMLVSDLLEIGMAQRRAYEEAQRKAAEANPAAPTGQTATPPSAEKPNGT
jgi:hypothetical protein